jgi:hypothetical protein
VDAAEASLPPTSPGSPSGAPSGPGKPGWWVRRWSRRVVCARGIYGESFGEERATSDEMSPPRRGTSISRYSRPHTPVPEGKGLARAKSS